MAVKVQFNPNTLKAAYLVASKKVIVSGCPDTIIVSFNGVTECDTAVCDEFGQWDSWPSDLNNIVDQVLTLYRYGADRCEYRALNVNGWNIYLSCVTLSDIYIHAEFGGIFTCEVGSENIGVAFMARTFYDPCIDWWTPALCDNGIPADAACCQCAPDLVDWGAVVGTGGTVTWSKGS